MSLRAPYVSPVPPVKRWQAALLSFVSVVVLGMVLLLSQVLASFQHETEVVELREMNDLAELPPPAEEMPELAEEMAPPIMETPPELMLEIEPLTPMLAMLEALPMDVNMVQETFVMETAPIEIAPLPLPKPQKVRSPKHAPRPIVPKAIPRVSAPVKPKVQNRPPAPRPRQVNPPAPPKKSTYSEGELDRIPSLRKDPIAEFPASLARKGVSEGKVNLSLEINEKGRVRVLGVVSSTHPELVPVARKAASTARFSKPTKNGRTVKATFSWELTLKK